MIIFSKQLERFLIAYVLELHSKLFQGEPWKL